MSKSIKVSEEVYQHLLEIQRPRESFSEEVSRLLGLYELLMKAAPIIEGGQEFSEWLKEQREKEAAAHR